MKLHKLIKRTILTLLVLAVTATAALLALDFGFLRSPIERKLQELSGRSVHFEEGLSIKLGPTLVVEARGLRMANSPWASARDFLSVDALLIEIPMASIWDGPVVIRNLHIEGLNLALEETMDDQANWRLEIPKSTARVAATDPPALIQHAMVENSNIYLDSPRLDRRLNLQIETARQFLDEQGTVDVDVQGKVNGETATVIGSLGSWTSLLEGSEIEVDAKVTFGNFQGSLSGTIDDLIAPQRPELLVSATAPSLLEIANMLGISGLEDGPVNVQLKSRIEGEFLSAEASVQAGGLDLNLRSKLPRLGDYSTISFDTRVKGSNFGRFARLAGSPGWPDQDFLLLTQMNLDDTGLDIGSLRLALERSSVEASGQLPSFPSLYGADFKLEVKGADLEEFGPAAHTGNLPRGPFAVSGQVLQSGPEQTMVDLDFSMPLATGSLAGTITDTSTFDMALTASGPSLKALGELIAVKNLPPEAWKTTIQTQRQASIVTIKPSELETIGALLSLEGQLDPKRIQETLDIAFQLQGGNFADLRALLPDEVTTPEEAYALKGRLSGESNAWQLHDWSARVGTSQLTLDGLLGAEGGLAGTRLRFTMAGVDAGRMFDLPGAVRLPMGDFSSEGSLNIDPSDLALNDFQFNAGSLQVEGELGLDWPLSLASGKFSLRSRGDNLTRVLPELADFDFDALDFVVDAKGQWNSESIDFERGQIRVGSSELGVSGAIDLPPNLSATQLMVRARSPDLSRLGTIDGHRWGTLPLDIEVMFSGNQHSIEMSRMSARLGQANILGQFRLDVQQEKPVFDIRLSTSTLDLRPFFKPANTPDGEADTATKTLERIIPELPISIGWLNEADGRFAVVVDRLLLRRLILHNTLLSGGVKDGWLQFNELGTDTYGGRLVTTFELGPNSLSEPHASLKAESRGLVPDFSNAPAEKKAELPPIDLDLDVTGSGADLRSLLGGLNGKFVLSSEGGKVDNDENLNSEGHLLARLITTISPSEARRDAIHIACFAAVGEVTNGLVALNPGLVLQSDRLKIFIDGNINLETESLDVRLYSRTRRLVDLSAGELIVPFVKIEGTMAKPVVSLTNPSSLLSSGAAVLSGGLTIFARKALDQLKGDKPCERFLLSAEQAESP